MTMLSVQKKIVEEIANGATVLYRNYSKAAEATLKRAKAKHGMVLFRCAKGEGMQVPAKLTKLTVLKIDEVEESAALSMPKNTCLVLKMDLEP